MSKQSIWKAMTRNLPPGGVLIVAMIGTVFSAGLLVAFCDAAWLESLAIASFLLLPECIIWYFIESRENRQ